MPGGTPTVVTLSPMFALDYVENNAQTVYFLNYNPPAPPSGSVTVYKNITTAQATDTTFTFTITPAVNGISTFQITVPAGLTQATYSISGVPFGVTYFISESTLAGWSLIAADTTGTTFTLSSGATFATPVFTNSPVTTPPPGIAVLGIQEGQIEVLGIQELPFTGQNTGLYIIGSILILAGASIMGYLIKKRKSIAEKS